MCDYLSVAHPLVYRKPPPWMTLDELMDKLLFLAVSDDGTLYSKP